MAKIEFRKEALERLQSPDHLDRPFVLIERRIWLIVVVGVVLTAATVIWAFLARLPVEVEAAGLFLLEGELTQIVAEGEATIVEVFVKDGDDVAKGQRLARLQAPKLENELAKAKADLAVFQGPTKAQAENHMAFLEREHERVTNITSPVEGVVLELMRLPVSPVKPGDTLMILSPKGDLRKDLVAHALVSQEFGKRIQIGMPVKMEVAGYNKSRYGFVQGKVRFVELLPTSGEAVLAYFKIPEIADALKKSVSGAPFYIEIQPELSETNQSGYAWTSVDPGVVISAGTFFKGYILIDENRPIDYVIPIFERILWQNE